MFVSLTAAPPRATAVAQQSRFFDQRRVDGANHCHLAMGEMNQRPFFAAASTAARPARWWRWQCDSAGATGWRWRRG